MDNSRNIATYVLAISLFSLALALVYFSINLAQISSQIPTVVESLGESSQKIQPVVEKMGEFKDEIPAILSEVRKVREQVPPVLEEIKQVRKQIPAVLEESRKIREQVPPILAEVKATREMVPTVVDEVKTTRESIPPMLTRAEKIVSEAKQIGKETSEGAFSGVLTGITKSPFTIIGGLGELVLDTVGIKNTLISGQDRIMAEKAARELLSKGEVSDIQEWKNQDTGVSGEFFLAQRFKVDGENCALLKSTVYIPGQESSKRDISACELGDVGWKEVELQANN